VDSDEIRRELAAARVEARRLAAEQQVWREQVSVLFEQARDAGLSTDEIVEALGLSGKWAEHLRRREARRAHVVTPQFFFGAP